MKPQIKLYNPNSRIKIFANTSDIDHLTQYIVYLDVGQHAKSRLHIQSDLVLPVDKANPKNQKSHFFANAPTEQIINSINL